MANEELTRLSLTEVAAKIRRQEVSPVEVLEATLARIGEMDGTLNSYITVIADEARKEAEAAEREIR